MEEEKATNDEQVCAKCGGALVQVEVLAGSAPLVVTKMRSALSLGLARGSAVSARVCAGCGKLEFFAINPEVLR